MEPTAWEFGPFVYDEAQRLLFRGGAVVPLVPKAVDTLHVLIQNRGRIVEKAELIRLVWPDAQVEDTGLARNVSLLRKALGDDAEPNLYIETIPRRGYRFIAELRAAGAAALEVAEARPGALPQPGARVRRRLLLAGVAVSALALFVYWQFYRPSRYLPNGPGYAEIAVAPFEAAAPELRLQARDLTELLSAELTALPRAHVVSPTTVAKYDRLGIPMNMMARMLGLHLMAEGSVHRAGAGYRVTARLADVHSGRMVWSRTLDCGDQDISRAAKEIAAEIAVKLR